jgi:hypothetical protein
MTCKLASENDLAERYLNGKLEESEQDRFETHILECTDCQRHIELLENLRTELADGNFAARPSAAVPRRWADWWRTASAVALATACCLLVLHFVLSHDKKNAGAEATQSAAAPNKEAEPEAVPPSGGSQPRAIAQSEASSEHVGRPEASQQNAKTSTPGVVAKNAEPAATTETEPKALPSEPIDVAATSTPTQQTATAAAQASTNQQATLTSAQGVELYRMGMVQPPQYTFAGLAHDAKLRSGAPSGSYSAGQVVKDGFENAMLAYVDGRYDAAAKMLEGVIQSNPKAPEANYYLGICRLMTGHPKQAVGPLNVVTGIGKSPLLQAAHFYLAKAYLQMSDLGQAEAELKASVDVPGRLSGEANALLGRVRAFQSAQQGATDAKPKSP